MSNPRVSEKRFELLCARFVAIYPEPRQFADQMFGAQVAILDDTFMAFVILSSDTVPPDEALDLVESVCEHHEDERNIRRNIYWWFTWCNRDQTSEQPVCYGTTILQADTRDEAYVRCAELELTPTMPRGKEVEPLIVGPMPTSHVEALQELGANVVERLMTQKETSEHWEAVWTDELPAELIEDPEDG